jgi:hypothetical protein
MPPRGFGKKLKTVAMRLSVSPNLFEYLGYLSRNTLLGASENDVAEYLLTQRLEAMQSEKYIEAHGPAKDSG